MPPPPCLAQAADRLPHLELDQEEELAETVPATLDDYMLENHDVPATLDDYWVENNEVLLMQGTPQSCLLLGYISIYCRLFLMAITVRLEIALTI